MKCAALSIRRHHCAVSRRSSLSRWIAATGMLLFLTAMPAHALENRLPQWPHSNSDLVPSPELHFGMLPSGLRYVLKRNTLPEGRVSMHLNVQVGSLHEAEHERGLAHFLEHLSFNGSTHFPPGELVKYFQRIGMEFGPDANAHTGFDETVYDILLASNQTADIREGLTVLSDYAQGALLLPAEIERERRVVLAEKRSRDSASYRTFVDSLAFEFPGARLPRRLPIGDIEAIRSMDRDTIKAFYDAWYRPELMMVIVVGDISIPDTERLVIDAFGTMTPRAPPRPAPGVGAFHHDGTHGFYHHETEAGETTVRLEVMSSIDAELDSRASRRRRFVADVANRIVQDRLNAELGKLSTPFTSADISSGVFLKEVAYAEITAECDPEQWSQTLGAMEQALRQALEYGFAPHELYRVKKDIQADLDQAEKQMPTRFSQKIARSIISAANRHQVFLSPRQEKALYGAILETLTLEEVSTAFRKTWRHGHRLILVTGNADLSHGDRSPEEILLAAYRAASAEPVQRPEMKTILEFPYRPSPKKLGEIGEKVDVADLGITQLKLANGVQVFIKPTDFKADELQVRISFGPGRAGVPPDLPGVGVFAEDLLNESGVGPLTKEDLDTALAGKNVSAVFSVKEDRFAFAGQSGKKDSELLFQLLAARLGDPVLRPSAARLVKARYAQSYKSAAVTFRGAMRVWGQRQLAGGDLRFGWVPDEYYAARTIVEVDRWLMPYFRKAPLEIVIVGDIDPGEAERLARKYFGSLEPRQLLSDDTHPVAFPTGRRFETPVDTRIDNSLLVVALPSTDMWGISLTRRLSVLAEVITEKLRVEVREALGATYSPFAVNRSSKAFKGYGTLTVFAEVAPNDADRIENAIRTLLETLAKDGIDEDLLRRVLEPTLTSIRDTKQQNRYWADTVLSGASRHPEQIDWSRTIAEDYAAISVLEINALARRYLSLPRAATLFFYPGALSRR